jgi:hypothetical protein
VVHTGVKSAGWLKKNTQESPAQSWKLIWPAVLSMVKFGAVEPSNKLMMNLLSGFAGGGELPLDVEVTITRLEGLSQYSYIYRANRLNK